MEIFNIRMNQWRITVEVDGANNSGGLKNSWWDWTVKDMNCLGPSQDNAQSRNNNYFSRLAFTQVDLG